MRLATTSDASNVALFQHAMQRSLGYASCYRTKPMQAAMYTV
jgi:hypothetical protein